LNAEHCRLSPVLVSITHNNRSRTIEAEAVSIFRHVS